MRSGVVPEPKAEVLPMASVSEELEKRDEAEDRVREHKKAAAFELREAKLRGGRRRIHHEESTPSPKSVG